MFGRPRSYIFEAIQTCKPAYLARDSADAVLMGLALVSLHRDPAVPFVNPTTCYPVSAWPWRLFSPSWGPYITPAIVIVMSLNPHMVTAGALWPPLHYDMGGRMRTTTSAAAVTHVPASTTKPRTIPAVHYQARLRLRA